MIFNFQKFCQDFRINTAPRGHAHNREHAGWINIECPFCTGHRGYHLGYNFKHGYFKCYRCGWHPAEKVISIFARTEDRAKIKAILDRYDGKIDSHDFIWEKLKGLRPDEVELPSGTVPMTRGHKDYLTSRGFAPEKLESLWGLQGTGHTGEYKFRVIAPITFNGQLVSYQGRDITGKQSDRYRSCHEENEVIPHKNIFYGWDQVPYSNSSCIVVEGITGVWRFGPGSLATFGVEYSPSQIRLLALRFEEIYMLFDPDEAGEKAQKMVLELRGLGKKAEQLDFITTKFDSGNLPQNIADELMMRNVIKRRK